MNRAIWGIFTTIALVLAFCSVAIVATASVVAQNCAIMTPAGIAQDYDCDGVIDDLDNCPTVGNTDQRDLNHNGVGDACDMLIDQIIINPDSHVRQGEFAHVTIRVLNNRDAPLQDVSITVRNKELGVDATQVLLMIPRGEAAAVDFWILVPKCAKTGQYALSVSTEFVNGQSEVQREIITVEKNNVCGTPGSALDTTIVNVFDKADVDRGENILIPISITNLGDTQATYDLSVQNVDSWGTWRIDPAPRMKLSAGHKDTAYLYLQTEQSATPGNHVILLTVSSENKKTVVPITIYVRSPISSNVWFLPIFGILFELFIILLLLLLIIITLVIWFRYRNNGAKNKKTNGKKTEMKGADNHAVVPYYDTHDDRAMKSDANIGANADVKKVSSKDDTQSAKSTKETAKRAVRVEPAGRPRLETYY